MSILTGKAFYEYFFLHITAFGVGLVTRYTCPPVNAPVLRLCFTIGSGLGYFVFRDVTLLTPFAH